MELNKKQIGVLVFWTAFVTVIGPALISHPSYEAPLLGLALIVAGGWATHRYFIKGVTK